MSFEVVDSKNNPISQLKYKLEHLHRQTKELSKYDDDVLDYNHIPVKIVPQEQAQPAKVHLQRMPKIESFQNNLDISLIIFILLVITLVLMF